MKDHRSNYYTTAFVDLTSAFESHVIIQRHGTVTIRTVLLHKSINTDYKSIRASLSVKVLITRKSAFYKILLLVVELYSTCTSETRMLTAI